MEHKNASNIIARTTMIKVGVWDVPGVGTRYRYRVCTVGRGREWSIYKLQRGFDPEHLPEYKHPWQFAETGFKTKTSAVEYVEELAAMEEVDPVKNLLFNHVADLIENIDDGINLNEEGRF